LHHSLDILQTRLATTHISPSSTHAKARAPVIFRYASGGENSVYGGHFGRLEAGLIAGGLCAVAAVFAATAGFDVHECAHLDGSRAVEAAVEAALLSDILC
jgi:hypothetical protein